MRIGINALSAWVGGTLTYLSNLLPALGQLDKRNNYVIFVPDRQRDYFSKLRLADNFTLWPSRVFGLLHRVAYEQTVLPYLAGRLGINLLYAPSEICPVGATCKVVLALRNPNLYTDVDLGWPFTYKFRFGILRFLAKASARRADRIITISEAWRESMAKKLGLPMEKVTTVHHGIADSFKELGRERLNHNGTMLNRGQYILSVSTVYRYKNYINLVRAFRLMRERLGWAIRLAIVGGNYDPPYFREMLREIRSHGLEGEIELTGNVAYSLMPSYYSGALFSAFPSYLETFGHPAVEAMAAAVPLAISDIPVFRELCGDACVYFNPFDVQDISAVLVRLATDDETRIDLARRGFERSQLFSWRRTAELTLAVFEEAMGVAH
jgi:glycosyltransferase involved in cell wall biosynthesis